MSAGAIEAHLAAARAARLRADSEAVLAALEAAWSVTPELDDDHPLTVVVAWKRAKARHDFGRLGDMVAALTPVVTREDLFDAYPLGLRGAERVCRAHQDELGFGNRTVRRLWKRLADHHRESGDRYLAARAQLELAWDGACRGEDVHPLLAPVIGLRPSDLEGSPSWHAEAVDAEGSLHHLFLEAAHTALRAAVWCGDGEEATRAAADLEHAVRELAAPPPIWVEHALHEAALHGSGNPPPPRRADGDGFDARFLRALIDGQGFEATAALAPGPEWELAASTCAVLLGELDPQPVLQRARDTGCLAFLQASESISVRTRR